MSKKIEESATSMDSVKLILAVTILVGTLAAYYMFADVHAVIRVLGVIAGTAVAGYVFYLTEKGRDWFSYLSNAKKEVEQVVWPTRQETTQMTLMVFVVVIIMGIFLWLVDMFFLWAVQLLTGQGG
ncbi:preprotein translocase subunit SecE [Thiosulfativibrio zosterae]|uniref:Protein translocase subunit SecE n=1 Tax=Thiosulfativibrio zosterae TaxID=2675053 RepID=A0A6F8PKT7_9GAMM|nr:preprotein translocase subunit SecE [Thiosulfativibrio zosterae]BBP42696.1 protein translocase subunit SecE [Thiosulfativibrio zosterae]